MTDLPIKNLQFIVLTQRFADPPLSGNSQAPPDKKADIEDKSLLTSEDNKPWEKIVKEMSIEELIAVLDMADNKACYYALQELATKKRLDAIEGRYVLDKVAVAIVNQILLKRNEENNIYVHDAETRSEALRTLGELLPRFKYGLTSGNEYTRLRAIDFFNNQIGYLLFVVQKGPEESVKVAASEALQKICAELIPDIINLTKSANFETRKKAKGLLKIIVDVFKKMMGNENEEIRRNVNLVLAKIGPYIIDDLKAALISPDPKVRLSAAVIISFMGKDAKDLTKDLIRRLKDPIEAVRVQTVWAFVQIGPDALLEICNAIHRYDSDTRINAISVLGKMAKEYYADEVRDEVIKTLRWAVLHLKDNELKEARCAAARALGVWGKKAGLESFSALIILYEEENMHNSDLDIKLLSVAAQAMYRIDSVKAINYLIGPNALKRPGKPVYRRVAASALGDIGVLALSGKGGAEVKVYAGLIADKLISSVENDYDPITRSVCARSLGNIASRAGEGFNIITEHIIDVLTEKLEDEDFNVRKETVEALGRIGKKARRAAPKLKAMKKNPNIFSSKEVRERINILNSAIDEALEKTGEK